MLTEIKFPLTNDDLADLLDTDGYYRFSAPIAVYWQLLADAQYRADYYDDQIIATMSYESDIHSRIASQFSLLLGLIYQTIPGHIVYNSNRPVSIEGCGGSKTGVFNADGMVVAEPRQPYEYAPGLSAETNPVLLIDILSPSTQLYDFGTKLPCYKGIPFLHTILYVRQDKPDVTVMVRQSPNEWHETRLQQLTDTFAVGGQAILLEKVYQGIFA